MLRQLIATVAVYGALAQASTGTTQSFKTVSGCTTASASSGTVPMALPTASTSSTVKTTLTADEVTVPATSTVTADEVTVTQRTVSTYKETVVTSTIPTRTIPETSVTTVGTVTWPVTVCNNGAFPTTVTSYSGEYTPVSGQVTSLPTPFPTQVLCTTGITWLTTLLPTATSGVTTVTVTPTSTVTDITTTETVTLSYTSVTYGTTVTDTTTSYHLEKTAATTSVACEPTVTTTLAAKCAPTNVIAGIGDTGLVSGRYADTEAIVYVDDDRYNDPSLCCQLCQDNDGCTAMFSGGGGYCALFYLGAADGGYECGWTLSYQTQPNVFPGQGLWVQTGCGEIEYSGSV